MSPVPLLELSDGEKDDLRFLVQEVAAKVRNKLRDEFSAETNLAVKLVTRMVNDRFAQVARMELATRRMFTDYRGIITGSAIQLTPLNPVRPTCTTSSNTSGRT